jgi:hypothetical protein
MPGAPLGLSHHLAQYHMFSIWFKKIVLKVKRWTCQIVGNALEQFDFEPALPILGQQVTINIGFGKLF